MPNTINLRLLDNKNIIAEMSGIPLAQENSYKIIAGEENATIFSIASKPAQYKDARYTVEMVNSQGYGIEETDIVDDTFALPIGMAVAGYGWVQIRAYQDDEIVPFTTLKVKVWNTIPEWKENISEGDSSLDVQINGVSIVENGVANIPKIGNNQLGVAMLQSGYGIWVASNGRLYVATATDTEIAQKTNQYKPIVPLNLDLAVKEGIANNSLILTEEEITKALAWLGAQRKLYRHSIFLQTDDHNTGFIATFTSSRKTQYTLTENDWNEVIQLLKGEILYEEISNQYTIYCNGDGGVYNGIYAIGGFLIGYGEGHSSSYEWDSANGAIITDLSYRSIIEL